MTADKQTSAHMAPLVPDDRDTDDRDTDGGENNGRDTAARDVARATALVAATAERMTRERDAVIWRMGEFSAFRAVNRFSIVAQATRLAEIKEKKLYRAMKGQIGPNGTVFDGTWDGLCEGVGVRKKTADEYIEGLAVFGEEALQALNDAGLGHRRLRDLRRLPDDDRAALIEAASSADRDVLLATLEDLMDRRRKEKEALEKGLSEARADLDAKEKLIAEKNTTNDRLRVQLEKREKQLADTTPDERLKSLRGEFACKVFDAVVLIRKGLRDGAVVVLDAHRGVDYDARAFLAGLFQELLGEIHGVQDALDLPRDTAGPEAAPDWLTADLDALGARLAAPDPTRAA